MKPIPFDHLWKDGGNWYKGVFYHCADDPRCIVPKQTIRAGRTSNFAHRKSYLIFAIMILFLLWAPLLVEYNILSEVTGTVAETLSVIATLIFFYRVDIRSK